MKRSPMPQRKAPMRQAKPLVRASAPAKAEIKAKRCRACRTEFFPARPMQCACSPKCAQAYAEKISAGKAKQLRRTDAAKTRAALEAIKTIPQLKREAQTAFNAWVRQRDAAQPCISCDAPPPDLSGLHAGRDCGHYRSTGSADHLRYSPDNAHAQCVSCNQHKAGNVVAYRQGLLRRIGPDRLTALEADSRTHKWTRDELRATRDTYRAKARELKKGACVP